MKKNTYQRETHHHLRGTHLHPNGGYVIDCQHIMWTWHATSLPPMHLQTQMIPIHKIKKNLFNLRDQREIQNRDQREIDPEKRLEKRQKWAKNGWKNGRNGRKMVGKAANSMPKNQINSILCGVK